MSRLRKQRQKACTGEPSESGRGLATRARPAGLARKLASPARADFLYRLHLRGVFLLSDLAGSGSMAKLLILAALIGSCAAFAPVARPAVQSRSVAFRAPVVVAEIEAQDTWWCVATTTKEAQNPGSLCCLRLCGISLSVHQRRLLTPGLFLPLLPGATRSIRPRSSLALARTSARASSV